MSDAKVTPRPIGPWLPRIEDGEQVFVHSGDVRMRGLFAAIEELRPKKKLLPLRIAFLGESAAGGWLYAPHVTPAKILEAQLAAIRGPGIFEVLDLTRIDSSARELIDLADAAGQLVPDLFVVYAGNNWPVRPGTFPDIGFSGSQRAAKVWRETASIGDLVLEETRQAARATVSKLAQIADAHGVGVVLVVPEVSLAGWCRRRPPTWLPGDGTNEWHRLASQAAERLRARDFEAARELAQHMLRLDRGRVCTSHAILARAEEGLGHLEAAEASGRGAVSAYTQDPFPPMPSATPAIQDVLREGAERFGFDLVDLPAIFAAHTGTPFPGTRMLLDYCHLRVEGMKVAMAAVADRILDATDSSYRGDRRSLLERLPDPEVPSEIDARAKFMTGVYAVHWSGRIEDDLSLGVWWIERALETSPSVRADIEHFLWSRCVPGDAMTLALGTHGRGDSHVLAGLHLRPFPSVDGELFEALVSLLERSGFDRGPLFERLLEVHGLGERGLDLLDPIFRWRPLDHEDSGALSDPRRLHHRSCWPKSEFCLIARGDGPIEVEIVARSTPGSASIQVGGREAAAIDLDGGWRRVRIAVPKELLVRGINRLTVVWPPLRADGDAEIARVAERWDRHEPADIHPIFGEITSLWARRT